VIRNNWPNILNRVMRICPVLYLDRAGQPMASRPNAVAAQDGGKAVIGKHRLISREFTDSEVGFGAQRQSPLETEDGLFQSRRKLAFQFPPSDYWCLGSATDAKMLPEPEPRVVG
jgi:hypothetical protein